MHGDVAAAAAAAPELPAVADGVGPGHVGAERQEVGRATAHGVAVAHFRHLRDVRIRRQGGRTARHGQAEGIQSEIRHGRVQPHSDRRQHLHVPSGNC